MTTLDAGNTSGSIETSPSGLEPEDVALVHSLVDQALIAMIVVDTGGALKVWNQEAARQFGVPAEEARPLEADGAYSLLSLDGRPLTAEEVPLVRALRGETLRDVSLVLRRADGSEVAIAGVATPLLRDDGTPRGAAMYLRDVSARTREEEGRKRLVAELEESRRRYRLLAQSYPNGAVVLYDRDLRFLLADGPALERIGFPREHMEGKTLADIAGEGAVALETSYRAPLEGRTFQRETTVEGRTFEVTHHPVRNDVGDIIAGLMTAQDVTEKRRAEASLRRAEQQMSRIMSSSMLGLLFSDAKGAVLGANDAFLDLVGYDRADLEQGLVNWRALTPPEWLEQSLRGLDSLHENGVCSPFEKEYFKKDGSRVAVVVGSTRVPEQDLNITFVLDISERKRAENERAELLRRVQRSEAELGLLVDNLPGLAWSADADGTVERYNTQFYTFTGRTLEQPRDWADVHHPDHAEKVLSRWGECLAQRRPFEMEAPLRAADGTFRWFLIRNQPLFDPSGAILRWFGTATDIDEAKKARLELEKLATIVDQSSDLIAVASVDGEVSFVNAAGRELVGLSSEDGGRRTRIEDFVIEEERPFFAASVVPAVLREGSWRGELRFRRPSGGPPIPVDSNIFLARDPESGEPLGLATVTRDVTEKKAIEQRLKDEAETLEIIDGVGQQLASELDQEKLVQAVTDAATRLAGAQFGAFFYTATGPEGETFTLYSISGVPREEFAKFPMPRNTKVFAPTFEGLGVVRSDDIKKDPRYGQNAPYVGMPAGHLPVTSYLAVPVVTRTGKAIGGLFFGHAEAGRFTQRAENLVTGLAAQAAIAMDNAALYQREQRAARTAEHERARLRKLLAEMPAGVTVSWGADHRFEWSNEIYQQVAGRDPSGRTVREAFPELEGQPFFALLDGVYESGDSFHGKEVLVRLDRKGDGHVEDTWFDFVYQAILDVEGKAEGILTVCMEVTDQVVARHRVESLAAELRRSEEHFRAVSETIPQMVFTIDADGAVDFVNQRLVEYLARPYEDILRRGWVEEIHDDDRQEALDRWVRSLQTGEPYELEYRIRASDGSYRWHLSRTLAVRDEHGVVARWFGTLTDITDHKRAVEERERLIDALEKSNRDLDQFAYVASHDLKAPLRGIASLSSFIEEDLAGKMSDEAKQHMAMMRGRVQRLEDLINGILQYSRAGRVKDKRETFSVGQLLDEVLELLQPPAGARLERGSELPTLTTERAPFEQVLLNLVSNAFKHGGPDTRVVVSCTDAGAFWELAVTDDGPGIAPQYFERIWGIFQTLAPRDKVEGTGIGLSVVRRLVESKGGHAWVESEPGAGATFRFTWPKREPAA